MEEAKWLRLRDLINYYGKDPSVDGIVVHTALIRWKKLPFS